MAVPTYDWAEPEIRRLVERHHTPDEEIVSLTADGVASARIICGLCRTSPWPCAILLDLRTWYENNERIRQLERATGPGKR